jgi:phosphohistidine phosphatase
MDLILWRHAEAGGESGFAEDRSRGLTHKGERQAARMATWLDRQLPQGTRILVSPARRAEQTAIALGRKYKLREELSPDSSAQEVLSMLKWDPAKGPVGKGPFLLVGHQPWIGGVVAQVLGTTEAVCPVRKGAVWWLRSRVRDERAQTLLMAVASPDLISGLSDDDPS